MPNWCKGSLKVRGKISDLKEFVQQGLEPVSYIGDALEPLVFTTEDETSFFVRENKVSLWMKGTHRHFCEPNYIEVYADDQETPVIMILPMKAAWSIDADGSFKEFTPDVVITNKIPWPYNPAAHDDLLDHTLNRLACDDPEVRALLEEMVGYCMYRRNELGKAFILIGDKSNGKSTFLHVVKNLLGDQNIASLDLKELGDRFKTAELFGKLANIGDDIGDEFIANASVFKKLVTGDRVNVERKGQDPFEFNNYSKFLFSANNIPRIKDKTGAVQRRLVIVPFDAKFTPNDADFRPFIKDELCEQGSMEYLALLGLQGLKRVLGNAQFTTSSRVQGQLDEYEENNNPIIGFINEVGLDGIENEATDSVYRRYKEYCIANNFQALSKIEFSRQITKRCGFTTVPKWIRNRKTRVFVKGGDTE